MALPGSDFAADGPAAEAGSNPGSALGPAAKSKLSSSSSSSSSTGKSSASPKGSSTKQSGGKGGAGAKAGLRGGGSKLLPNISRSPAMRASPTRTRRALHSIEPPAGGGAGDAGAGAGGVVSAVPWPAGPPPGPGKAPPPLQEDQQPCQPVEGEEEELQQLAAAAAAAGRGTSSPASPALSDVYSPPPLLGPAATGDRVDRNSNHSSSDAAASAAPSAVCWLAVQASARTQSPAVTAMLSLLAVAGHSGHLSATGLLDDGEEGDRSRVCAEASSGASFGPSFEVEEEIVSDGSAAAGGDVDTVFAHLPPPRTRRAAVGKVQRDKVRERERHTRIPLHFSGHSAAE